MRTAPSDSTPCAKRCCAPTGPVRRFFESQPPSYRKTAAYWVVSAKREATRDRRLKFLIECSRQGRRLPQLER